ncbi:MAG: hypothetical protein FK730_14085 [Asgard group archaeon]|nr:hypothetical protein [Asgard group archaeon]
MKDIIANLILRILWSAFFGWWITIIWYFFAFIFVALVFSVQLGYWMLDRSERVFSFERDSHQNWRTRKRLVLGVFWFYLIGWWAGLLLISLASVCVVSIIGFPLGIWLMRHLDEVVILS